MSALSFRARLTLRWTAAFGCILALASVAIYGGTRAFLVRDFDAQLRTLAGTELASATDGLTGVHFHEFPAEILAGEYAGKFAQTYDSAGHLLRQSATLDNGPPLLPPELLAAALDGHAPVFDVAPGGRPGRMVALSTLKDGEAYVVAVGLFTEPVLTTLRRLSWLLAIVSIVGLGATALVGLALATRALRPIAHVTERAARIARGDFSARLDPPLVDDEIGRMTALLNEMLERLHGAVEVNRRFASDASHELRSPLTAMLGEIDVALKRPRTSSEYRESLSVVRERIHALTDVTEQLMILVRAQEGHAPPAVEIPLEPLARDAAAALAPIAADRSVTLRIEPMHGAVVYADRALLLRVLDNLLRNAVQYNRPHGMVTVSCQVDEPAVNGPEEHESDVSASEAIDAAEGHGASPAAVIRVTDTGVGIPVEERDRVFERFYRTDRSRSRRTGGTGLGLSIASEVVRLFGGTIRVSSSSPDGTTIELRLPGGRVRGARGAPYVRSAAS
ncbi:MAG: ATP-binding protein [Vicinamibacterales bacterium]